MKSKEEVLKILKQELPYLKEKYKVKSIGMFGSYVRGEPKKSSDIDILVEFYDAPSLLKFIEMENYLGEALETKVDLVIKDALKPAIGRHVLEEVVLV